jgi:multiple sugar transport system ATP-binding protein
VRRTNASLTLGLRPEAIVAAPFATQRAGLAMLPARLRRSENLGAEHILHVDLAAPASGTIVCTFDGDPQALTHDTRGMALLFAPERCHVFDADGQRVEPEAVGAISSVMHA